MTSKAKMSNGNNPLALARSSKKSSAILCFTIAMAVAYPVIKGLHKKVVKIWNSRQLRPPFRLIFIRHGESEGNIDHDIYETVPDSALNLTPLGWDQARAAGAVLKQMLHEESIRFVISPYVRTVQTYQGLLSAWDSEASKDFKYSEEPRIREQDFGNFQDPEQILKCKSIREKFGSFFYRFPSGESPADVYDRVSSFLESLHRMFTKCNARNYVLVTHGVTIRVLLMRYFRYTVRDFEKLDNFKNGEFVVLERSEEDGHMHIKTIMTPEVVKSGSEDQCAVIRMVASDSLRLWSYNSAPISPLAEPYHYPRRRSTISIKLPVPVLKDK